jgi:hypothetical protein
VFAFSVASADLAAAEAESSRAPRSQAAVREREAAAMHAGERVADLRERLRAAEEQWDGVEQPEVGGRGRGGLLPDF